MDQSLNVKVNKNITCAVCETVMGPETPAIILNTPRGQQPWARCPSCHSYFAADRFDPVQEVGHVRSRPWGMAESGVALNEHKSLMFETIIRLLRRYARPGSEILDIGCSFGGFLQTAKAEGFRVRGLDIVPEAVSYVRSLGMTGDCAKSVSDLAIPENSLQIISVLDCNCYWPSQKMELRALHKRLMPEGLLVMRVVDTSWAVTLGLRLRRFFPTAGQRLSDKSVYDHLISAPVRSLLRVMEEEGFEIVYTNPRDALPSRESSWKVRTAYAVGQLVWRMTGRYLSPGCVILARKLP